MHASAVTLLLGSLAGSRQLAAGRGWLWGDGWAFFLAMIVLFAVALLLLANASRPAYERKRLPPARPERRRRTRRF